MALHDVVLQSIPTTNGAVFFIFVLGFLVANALWQLDGVCQVAIIGIGYGIRGFARLSKVGQCATMFGTRTSARMLM